MLTAFDQRRSWITQRLANRYPPWSKLREFAQSVGQQILEPAGRELEDLYWWTNYNLDNYLLNTSDCNQIDGIRYIRLPSTFEWNTVHYSDSLVYLTPTVRGELSSGWIDLTQATDNSLEEFWYGVPSRITLSSDSYTYRSPLPSTSVANLSTTSLSSPSIPCKLWITLSGNGSSIKNYKGREVHSHVIIEGYDIHNNYIQEVVYFVFNGTIQTKNAWSELTSISTNYIDDSATIRIDWLSIGQTELIDFTGLHVNSSREKFRFYSLGSQSYGSTLQHKVFSSDDLVLVQEGEETKHSEYEIQLLNSAGSNITGLSLAIWPKRRWIIISDGSSLHFFVPDVRYENLEPTAEQTTEAVVQIGIDKEWSYQGDTVTLDYTMKRPFVRVLRTRWSVEKPDGTRVCISPSGAEIAYSESGWVNHPEGTTFNKVGFQGDYIDYTISDKGRYVFYLESKITDILSTEGQSRPIDHTDVRILHSAYDTAQTSISLPVSVGTGSTIGFDSYHRPWIVNTNSTAYRLNFHHDVFLADFKNKTIYVREEYSNLEVEA